MAFISQVAPAAMVFIPCKDGRSHTPEEWATAEALAAGTEVLLEAILEVDRATAVLEPVVQHREHQRRPAQQAAAGKVAVRQAREHVESLRRPGHRLRDQLARRAP